ncbi:MAG: hypothetical protein P8J67_07240 [Flavobacteriaceae bacterium]|nr:hypothetical protein [Flavobacteriaceae bacterium]|tara:strand:- start:668 stop:1315 length:648 start_codon:yes stop_codon:yes gene_type:complete
MRKLLILMLVVSLSACKNVKQEAPPTVEIDKSGEPDGPHTSTEWKIWALSTAAPSFIATNCTVIDSDGKTILREGTNGWTAMAGNPRGMSDPDNGWKDPHEAMPMVMDTQAMKWAMAYMSGKKPELDHDGWMYMLHGDMGEDNTKQLVFNKEDAAEGHWIESGSHLMLMPKDPSSLIGQTTNFNSGSPYIMFEGTGYDHIMIPLEGYYDYQPQKK